MSDTISDRLKDIIDETLLDSWESCDTRMRRIERWAREALVIMDELAACREEHEMLINRVKALEEWYAKQGADVERLREALEGLDVADAWFGIDNWHQVQNGIGWAECHYCSWEITDSTPPEHDATCEIEKARTALQAAEEVDDGE